MSAMLQNCPPVQSAYEEYLRFAADPVMREKVRARERFLNDERLKLAGARREGHAEGKAEGKAETAINLIAMDLLPSDIARAIGLSLDEIENLKKTVER